MSVSKGRPSPAPERPSEDRAGAGITALSAEQPSAADLAAMDPQTRLAFENRARLDREAEEQRQQARGEEVE